MESDKQFSFDSELLMPFLPQKQFICQGPEGIVLYSSRSISVFKAGPRVLKAQEFWRPKVKSSNEAFMLSLK